MLLSATTGQEGSVYSFEPVPETYSYLCNNLNILNIKNVTAYNFALSDRAEDAYIHIPKSSNGLPNFYEAKVDGSKFSNNSIPIQCKSLDSYETMFSHKIACIKIDVEGHEWPLIKGAKNLIKRDLPILFIEIDDDLDAPSGDTRKLLTYLTEQGYNVYIQHDKRLIIRKTGQSAIDYFFIHKSTPIPNGLVSR